MPEARTVLHLDDMRPLSEAVFGSAHALVRVDRLVGGSKKGVYRLTLADTTTSIAFVWNAAEDYWPTASAAVTPGPFDQSSGLVLLEAAQRTLAGIGVRVPRLFFADRSGSKVPGDVAVVEDVTGGTLEALFASDAARGEDVLRRLAASVARMHGHRVSSPGRPTGDIWPRPVEPVILDRALRHLREVSRRVERIRHVESRLHDELVSRFEAIEVRDDYAIIHGELGPDHVLVAPGDEPVIIDIEGTMAFDVEWEHVFLELRFRQRYTPFATAGLDPARLRLYRLAMYLSLVEGPLRLLDGDFPDRDLMSAIAEGNIVRTLRELQNRGGFEG